MKGSGLDLRTELLDGDPGAVEKAAWVAQPKGLDHGRWNWEKWDDGGCEIW